MAMKYFIILGLGKKLNVVAWPNSRSKASTVKYDTYTIQTSPTVKEADAVSNCAMIKKSRKKT